MEHHERYEIAWRITHNCDLSCGHCAYGCGPGKESISLENARKIIDNLPKFFISYVMLTGGEPMTVKPLLGGILDYFSSSFPVGVNTILHSNGNWLRDLTVEEAAEEFSWMHEKGVRHLSFMGDDRFHKMQGLDVNNLHDVPGTKVHEALKKAKLRGFVGIGGCNHPSPFGRAASLKGYTMNEDPCRFGDDAFNRWQAFKKISIDPKGMAYLCCYTMPYPIGSVVETYLDDIVDEAKKDPVLLALRGGLKNVAQEFGVTSESGLYRCQDCEEIFEKVEQVRSRSQVQATIPCQEAGWFG